MSTQSILRSIASPSRTAFKQPSSVLSSTGPKSILRRPPTLPLSPNPMPIAQPFSILASPKSPHVRFPSSPNMVQIHTALSPSTYDRAAITVSPNPLALPAWGDRVFSPSSGSFRRSEVVKQATTLNRPALSVTFKEGDLLTVPGKAVTIPPSNTRAGARFRQNLASNATKVLPRDNAAGLGNALAKYPRSPYPSAPLSPASKVELETGMEVERPQRRASMSGVVEMKRPKGLNVPRASTPIEPSLSVKTVAADSALSPIPASARISNATSPETRLSNAFWQSLTLEQPKSILRNANEKPLAEEMDVPMSAVPRFAFKRDALWSPGLPKKMAPALLSPIPFTPSGLLSPGLPSAGLPSATKKAFLSPTPIDATASFPSFASVMGQMN